MEVRELGRKIKNTMSAVDREKRIKDDRAADDKMRKGMFEFLDAQDGWLDFAYRKYPGETIKMIRITHGEICDLPMGLIRHLNNTKKKVRRYDLSLPPEPGKAKPVRTYQYISRMRFTPMDVM